MSHKPYQRKIWAGALSALLALFAALVVATPALAAGETTGPITVTGGGITSPNNHYSSLSWAFYDITRANSTGPFTVDVTGSPQTEYGTPELYGNVDVTINVSEGVSVDLGDYTIVLGPSSNPTPASLTISGGSFTSNGTENNDSVISVQNGSTLELNETTITYDGTSGYGIVIRGKDADNPSTLNVYNSTINAQGNSIAISGNNQAPIANITIGKDSSDISEITGAAGIYQPTAGTVTMNGGTITATEFGIAMVEGTLDMNGGTIEVTGNGTSGTANIGAGLNMPVAAVSVAKNDGYGPAGATVDVTGGTLNNSNPDNTNPAISYTNDTSTGDTSTGENITVANKGKVVTRGKTPLPDSYLPEGTVPVNAYDEDGNLLGTSYSDPSNPATETAAKETLNDVITEETGEPPAEITNGNPTPVTPSVNTVKIVFADGKIQYVTSPMTTGTDLQKSADAITRAQEIINTTHQAGTIYYTTAPTGIGGEYINSVYGPTYNGMPVGYEASKVGGVTAVTMGFDPYYNNGAYPELSANDAINEAMGTEGVNYFGSATPNNVMWAVVTGTPNTLASVSFSYATAAAGQSATVFANSNYPTSTQKDNVPSYTSDSVNTLGNYVPITNNGKGVVWFSMDVQNAGDASQVTTGYGAGSSASVTTLPAYSASTPTNPGGLPYPNSAPVCANYTATAWLAGTITNTGAASNQSPVGVNGVTYQYINNDGKATLLAPSPYYCKNFYAQTGDEITLSQGTEVPTFGTVSGWSDGANTYPINGAYTLPAPSGFEPVEMTAVFGATVTLNLVVPNEQSPHFPTGGGINDPTNGYGFVDDEGKLWPGTNWYPTSTVTPNQLLVGTDANRVLPTLPGVKGWNGNVFQNATGPIQTLIDDAFPDGTAAAFVGWYSWDNTNGYQLWEAGDTVPQYAKLQLYPLFAPVTTTWTPAVEDVTATTPEDLYDWDAWTAPGLTSPYELTVATDESVLPGILNVASVETSQAASDLLQALAFNDVNDTYENAKKPALTPGYAYVEDLGNVWFLNDYEGYINPFTGQITPSGALTGAKATYTGESTGEFTFNVYVPDGMRAYGNGGLEVFLPSITQWADLPNGTDTTPSGSGPLDTTLGVDVVQVFVDVNPADGGSVSIKPITDGDQAGMVELTAVPAEGYAFDRWSILGGAMPQGIDPTSATIVVPDNSGEWVANFVSTSTSAGTVNVYRLLNPDTQEHLYTIDQNEYNALINSYGWEGENVAWVAPESSATPIYRLSFPGGGHLYTTSLNEYNYLDSHGWTGEGTAMYSAANTNSVPIYRLFKPGVPVGFSHLWTSDFNEYTVLAARYGWQQESVAFYAVSAPGM